MQIYRSLEKIPFFENTWLTMGTFDGLHRGHQQIIRQLTDTAGNANGRSVLITFDPHPLTIIGNGLNVELLTTTEEKLELLSDYPVDVVLIIPFTESLAKIDADDFLKRFLIEKIGMRGFITGINHAFGRKQSGTLEQLRTWSHQIPFKLIEVPPSIEGGSMISSTRIRHSIKNGDVATAIQLLGYPYQLNGFVKQGMNLGKRIGFPTANLHLSDPMKAVPKDGVYAVRVALENTIYNGMMNIGTSPTILEKSWGIEIFIDNFNKNIYNKALRVQLIDRIRDEKRFESIDDLVNQIKKDKQKTQAIMANRFRRNEA